MTQRPATGYLAATDCAVCGDALPEPFGWCENCRAAYCLACARGHFCRPTCQAAGCLAGLCVRLISNGELSTTWGVPEDLQVHSK
jgi:hypothetical protein